MIKGVRTYKELAIFFTVVWEKNAVYSLPLILLTLVRLTPFLALQLSFLVFVEAFEWCLFTHLATSRVVLMFPEGYVVCKGRAAAVTLWRK
jgi:hypothetical protein